MTGGLTCLDFTVSAGTVTFSGTGTPTISGSMSLITGTLWPATGFITFNATTTGKTVTTNGVSFAGYIVFSGVGGYWTLGSSLTSTNATNFQIGGGTFDTGGYALTVRGINLSFASNARAVKLNNSTVTLNGTGSVLFLSTVGTVFSFDAGTSQINITGNAGNIVNSSLGPQFPLTFYNVAFTSTANTTATIQGISTFNNLSVAATSGVGVTTLNFNGIQTINGTLSTTGTAGNRRVFFTSSTYGISTDLVVNSAPSLTDADFRGLYVRGTAAPISGTRIGNRGECRGITFSTPKTVYWNLGGTQNWSANAWATTATGTPSTDNFPLPQDTATFTNSGSVSLVGLDSAIGYVPNVDMSGRTNSASVALTSANICYGNWTNGSGVTLSGTSTLTFSGGGTQTITSAGKAFSCQIAIDTYGGTVELADALNLGVNAFQFTNGTFDTGGYTLSVNGINSTNNTAPRTLTLRNSTINNSGSIQFVNSANLILNAGTSNITINGGGGPFISCPNPLTFYNLTFGPLASSPSITGSHTFNNLTLSGPNSAGINTVSIANGVTVSGTLTCVGASPVRRIFLQSDTIGTPRTITAAAISATDCDFRDINLAGAASGASPTRAGNCGGNTGITFPAPKTVYWNLAGAVGWTSTGWATSSGGTPAINNFPLAQDTAVFDNAGSVGTVVVDPNLNVGTFDASARTSAMTLTTNNFSAYGDWKFGTGVTHSNTVNTITFSGRTTQTITSNGVQFGCSVTINHPLANVQLADALSLNSLRTLAVTSSTFDAVTYNVTTGLFLCSGAASVVRMGSGTWTIAGTGSCWSITSIGSLFAGTATIVLSDTSTTARTFNGNGLYYNKLTIGGATGTSTLTISGSNTFGELASTKTVAHTITFPATQTTVVGKWSVTGTLGNIVTLNSSTPGTSWQLTIAGPANSGIDYLSVRDCLVPGASPGEFYVGANSTNVSNNTGTIIFTATPAPRTLYWVGGTGNWSSTTKWDTTSGGGGGAAIPTSLDAVIFNSASNATAYTATIDAGVTLARCASFTMAGPASGNVTFAGSVGIAFHGNVSFAATGITRTYTGAMQWAGNSSYTFTTNGVTLGSSTVINGVGCGWTLGSALNIGSFSFTVTNGTFNTVNFNLTAVALFSSNTNDRTITLGSSTVTLSTTGSAINFSTSINLTFNANTSSIVLSGGGPSFIGGGNTFNNVSFTIISLSMIQLTGNNTFNNLSFAGLTSAINRPVVFYDNQTINGTLTLSAGTNATMRTFVQSDVIGTTRTLTCAAVASLTDIDFRDIAIAGAAAPVSGTRLGDCKGNSGITFPAAKTVYFASGTQTSWASAAWNNSDSTSGASITFFPLAQDTAIFQSFPNSGNTVTIASAYNIGTIDMSARTSNAMTLATSTTTPTIYGNWINGTGTTLTGTGNVTFAGRGSQTITSAGKTFTQQVRTETPGGSVTLQDALTISENSVNAFLLTAGTFNAATYNVTLSAAASAMSAGTSTSTRTLALGSGTWTLAGTVWSTNPATNITVTGTGTISLTSASAKTFAGGGISYSGITLNQGGAGTLTISGNNTFANISNTYKATGATTIAMGTTTQRVGNFTASGEAGRVLTVTGTSASSPATLILTSGTVTTPDYLTVTGVRAYNLTDTWYAGANSTNNGSLGWIFAAGVVAAGYLGNFFAFF
jgi:hypothetical protein